MTLQDLFRYALRALLWHRARSALSLLGMGIGVRRWSCSPRWVKEL